MDPLRIPALLPDILSILTGAAGAQHWLGEGKDGTVFKMFNPADDQDTSFDALAVKVWKPNFKARTHEVELQRDAERLPGRTFRVPRVHHVDLALGCFVMDRVDGETAQKAIFDRRRRVARSFLNDVLAAFVHLHRHSLVHGDAHLGNWMFGDPEFDEERPEVIVDGVLWIIDFGHSHKGGGGDVDLKKVRDDLAAKVVEGI